jgi:hypothetical protein
LIIQWGSVLQTWGLSSDGSPVVFTFPIEFPNAVFQVVATQQIDAQINGNISAVIVGNPTKTSVTVYADGSTGTEAQTNVPLRIFAIGY